MSNTEKQSDRLPEIGVAKTETLPSLESIDTIDGQRRRTTVARTLRTSPALRTLADITRSDEDLFNHVAAFMSRRDDFKATYDTPGRSVAPWFAALARHNPSLLDVALHEHFQTGSRDIQEQLGSDAKEKGYTYIPVLVVGTGPQSQVFVSSLVNERPELTSSTLVIDSNQSVGGTFSEGGGMNFRLNSRTRQQTDEAPVPGTKSNINTLTPGIVALPDMVSETYAGVDALGRTVAINHALNGSPIGLGFEVVSVIPDQSDLVLGDTGNQLPGSASVVVKNSEGEVFTIRAGATFCVTGLGEPKLSSFTKDTQALIKDQQEVARGGGKPVVMTYTDFYRRMREEQFPLEGIKNVTVIGDGDSARTAVGTLLGYEPRPDDSVTQIDTVEEVRWYGQNAEDDRQFVESTRFRYAQLGLEFTRRANTQRYNRIKPSSTRVSSIELNDEGDKAFIFGNESDLVILANGFENDGQKWLTDKVAEPIYVTDQRIQDLLSDRATDPLRVGETILLPEGLSVREIQVLYTYEEGGERVYTVALKTDAGETVVGDINERTSTDTRRSLSDYCNLEGFGDTALGEPEPALNTEVRSAYAIRDLSKQEKVELLERRPLIYPSRYTTVAPSIDRFSAQGFQVQSVSEEFDTLVVRRVTFDRDTASFTILDDDITVVLNSFLAQFNEAEREGILVFDSPLTKKPSSSEVSIRSIIDDESLIALGEQNVTIAFSNQTGGDAAFVTLYKLDGDTSIKYVVGFADSLWEANQGNLTDLQNLLTLKGLETTVTILTASEQGEVLSPEKQRGISGRSFAELSEPERLSYLKPGTVIYSAQGNSSNNYLVARSYVIERVSDGNVTLVALEVNPDTQLYRQTSETVSLPTDLLLNDIKGTAAILPNSPTLESPTNMGRREKLTTSEILNRVDQLAESGAAIVASSKKSFLNTIVIIKQAPSSYTIVFRRTDTGYAGSESNYSLSEVENIISRGDNSFDTVVYPTTSSLRPGLKFPAQRPKPSIVDVTDDNGRMIARRLEDSSVILAGPAAGLTATPEAVRLIPDIPENSAGIFISQPRTAQVASQLAVRGRLPQQLMTQAEEVVPEVLIDTIVSKKRVTVRVDDAEDKDTLSVAERKMGGKELLLFGLMFSARRNGIKLGDAEAAKQISFTVTPRTSGFDVTIASDSELKPTASSIGLLLDHQMISHSFATLMRQMRTDELNVHCVIDNRGVQPDSLEVTGATQRRARTSVRTVPSVDPTEE